MSLRRKAFIIAFAALGVLFLAMYATSHLTLLEGFRKIESQNVRQNVRRVLGALEQEYTSLSAKAGDWAGWEEADRFVAGQNPDFVRKNLVITPFLEMRVHFMVFLNASGSVVRADHFDLDRAIRTPFPDLVWNAIVHDQALQNHKSVQSSPSGVLMVQNNPVLVTSRPIFDPSASPPRITGTLIMGRYLDRKEIKRLSAIVRLPLFVRPFEEARSGGADTWVEAISADQIAGFGLVRDIHGKPAFVIQTSQDRAVFKQGLLSMRYFGIGLVVSGLAFLVLLFWLLKTQLVDEVEQLAANVVTIGFSQDLTKRLPVEGSGEIARLASAVNMMLSGLEHAKQIQESEERFRQLFFNALTANFLANPDGSLILCNHQFAALFGFSSAPEAIQTSLPELLEDPSAYDQLLKRIKDERKVQFLELSFKNIQGERLSILANLLGVFDEGEDIRHIESAEAKLKQIHGFLLDITDRKKAEEALKESEQRYRALFENTINPIFLIDEHGSYIDANQAAIQFLGINREELLKRALWDSQILEILRKKDFSPFSVESAYKSNGPSKANNAERTLLMNIVPIKIQGRQVVFSIGQEITERKQMEERLSYLSMHDALTGLYNRTFFEEELRRLELTRLPKLTGIIVCDLDSLKFVNDNLGHEAGDLLIVEAASLIRSSFRAEDILARVGGDEFIILLSNATEETTKQAVARLRKAIQDYNAGQPSLPLSIATGYAVAKKPESTLKEALRIADERMYKDKAQNRQFVQESILPKLQELIQKAK
ncbi:MAG: diguanylate cyclase [Nitrospirota bacterium]|nr:diguanylate cyclase [Nitrospirota bacterium]